MLPKAWRQKQHSSPYKQTHPLRLRIAVGTSIVMNFSTVDFTPIWGRSYCLTSVIEALESFKDFSPTTRAAAIALRAKGLGINSLHFYMIALHAGLEVAR